MSLSKRLQATLHPRLVNFSRFLGGATNEAIQRALLEDHSKKKCNVVKSSEVFQVRTAWIVGSTVGLKVPLLDVTFFVEIKVTVRINCLQNRSYLQKTRCCCSSEGDLEKNWLRDTEVLRRQEVGLKRNDLWGKPWKMFFFLRGISRGGFLPHLYLKPLQVQSLNNRQIFRHVSSGIVKFHSNLVQERRTKEEKKSIVIQHVAPTCFTFLSSPFFSAIQRPMSSISAPSTSI